MAPAGRSTIENENFSLAENSMAEWVSQKLTKTVQPGDDTIHLHERQNRLNYKDIIGESIGKMAPTGNEERIYLRVRNFLVSGGETDPLYPHCGNSENCLCLAELFTVKTRIENNVNQGTNKAKQKLVTQLRKRDNPILSLDQLRATLSRF